MDRGWTGEVRVDEAEPDRADEGGADDGAGSGVSARAVRLLAAHEGAIRVLRWAAAIAFLVWLLDVILTASLMWDATSGTAFGDPSVVFAPGPVESDMSTAERFRATFVATAQTGGYYLIAAIVSYAAAALLARTPVTDRLLSDEP